MVLAGLMVGLVGLAPVVGVLGNVPVAAEAPPQTKAEADRLLAQGLQQAETSQFKEAIQSWQQVLIM
jgi:hypothetical protein